MFLIKENVYLLDTFLGGGRSGNFEKGGGRTNIVRYGILHDHTSKKRKIESTPLHSTFKLKYHKNVKLTLFLIKTSVKAQK